MTEAADDDVVEALSVVAAKLGISLSTLRRLLAAGQGPDVVQLSDRRQGITRRGRREFIASRTRSPMTRDESTSPPANSRNNESNTSMELRK
jgi:hypothetical protein